MSESTVVHATLFFERMVPATCNQVFTAYASVEERQNWGAPSDNTALIYDRADFSEGGEDVFRCGAKSNPNIHGAVRYLDIVVNRRIVSTETISVDGRRLCASLSTLEFEPDGDRYETEKHYSACFLCGTRYGQGARERYECLPGQSGQLLFESQRQITQVHQIATLPHA